VARLVWALVLATTALVFVGSFAGAGAAMSNVRALPAALISPLPSPSLPAILPSVPVALPSPSLPPVDPPHVGLPSPLPVTPPALPSLSPLPSPSVPVTVGTPTPSVPAVLPTPSSSPSPKPGGGAGSPGGGTGAGSHGGGSGPGGGITIPLTGIVIQSAFDAALLGAAAALPLLFGIWLLLFGRTFNEARRSRDAQVRLALAHDLGIGPRELTSVSTKALFKLREEAAFDEMTGVLRRAAGISALDREVARARRQKRPLSVAFVDVDGLKEANDKKGHKAGDDLLRNLAAILRSSLRASDLVLRYGGDEFVCVLPDTVADAARAKLSWVATEADAKGISFSSGVAQLERSDDVVSLLGRADTEMYAVKSRRGKIRDIRLGVVGGSKTVPA